MKTLSIWVLLLPTRLLSASKRDLDKAHYRDRVRHCQVPAEVLTAFLIKHMIANVPKKVNEKPQVVITVPAYFDEKNRTATQQAAKLAGIEVIDIINEPTAAAIAVAHRTFSSGGPDESTRNILVYDLGGGTFDVTVLSYDNRTFRALATDGERFGGRDFDARIADIIAQEFVSRHGIDPRLCPIDQQKLMRLANITKHKLTREQEVQVSFQHANLLCGMTISRQMFEDAISPLIERTVSTTSAALECAGFTWDLIDEVILVGGSSRVPYVFERLQQLSQRALKTVDAPDHLIAHGAALFAAAKTGFLDDDAKFEVVNVKRT